MIKIIYATLTILFFSIRAVFAQHALQEEGDDPPYLAHSSNFMMIMFNLKATDVQKLLPDGVEVNANDAGLVNAGLEMYETDRIWGVPQYGIVFMFVEVKGMESNNGTPGHWALWGKVNERTVLQKFTHHFSFPYQYSDVKITKEKNVFTGRVGSDLVNLQIKLNDAQPFKGEGIVNMCSFSADGKIVKSEVPWFSTGVIGELVKLEINAQGDNILEMVKNVIPHFVMVSTNQSFCYSRVVKQ